MAAILKFFESPVDFQSQHFEDIRRQCRNSGILFEDSKFPANSQSLFSVNIPDDTIRWDRIKALAESPCLLVREKRSREVDHGQLGTCWVPAVAAALLVWPEYAEKAMPDLRAQETELQDAVRYVGAFHFRLHLNDEPHRVTVDDRLPRRTAGGGDSGGELPFARPSDSGEFFAPLLEKALAKLHGSYKALEGLTLEQGLECATGGLCHHVTLPGVGGGPDFVVNGDSGGDSGGEASQLLLFDRLQAELEQRALLLLRVAGYESDSASPDQRHGESGASGLLRGHAYLVTGVRVVPMEPLRFQDVVHMAQQRGDLRRRHRFVRVRNPWGLRSGMWRGAWSEGSAEMASLSDSELDRFGLTYEDESDSWMTLADLCANFAQLVVCRVHNLSVLSLRDTWHEAAFRGAWTDWLSGGCLEKGGRPLTNPQFMVEVTGDDVDFDISLSQKTAATAAVNSAAPGAPTFGGDASDLLSIGLAIFQVESNREYRAHRLENCQVTRHVECSQVPRITIGLRLSAGRYVVVPCTEIASQEAGFTLRIYSRASCNVRELVADKPPASLCFAFSAYPEVGTRVVVLHARGLPRLTLGSRPFCQVTCGAGAGNKARTRVCSNTCDPDWNQALVFYRRPDERVITFEIRADRPLVSVFLAQGQLDQDQWFKGDGGEILELPLYGHRQISGPGSPMRPSQAERVRLAAKLYVQVFSTNDLLYI